MNTKLMKVAVILLTALALLGTAGAVSAATNMGTLSINVSTGEITDGGVNYTGYIVFTPNSTSDFELDSFRIIVASDNLNVTLSESSNTDDLFANYTRFSYTRLNNATSFSTAAFLPPTSQGSGSNPYELLTAGTPYIIDSFNIHVDNSTITSETVNLSYASDFTNKNYLQQKVSYLGRHTGSSSVVYKLNDGINGTSYMLNNATANSVAIPDSVSVTIETNGTIFDGNVSVFSELTKLLPNSSSTYFLNYSSADADVIKFYNYSSTSAPEYVVLKGTDTADITVNLTNKTSGAVIDSKTFTVTTTPINVSASWFNYTANHTYPYNNGKSVASSVLSDVKKSILNHSIGAADSTDNASTYGYERSLGTITLTFFSDVACTKQVIPADGGTYYFNVSVASNDNYNAATNLTIANNSFVINGATIYGVATALNISYFNATTPARVTVAFNATGMDLNLSVFNITTIVPKYEYFMNSYNLSFKQVRNFTGTQTNYTISSDNSTITFNASTSPTDNITYFDFVGCPRGDVTMDGNVYTNDASVLSQYYANASSVALTNEQLFYASVSGQNYIELVDIRQIAQFAGGVLTPDYKSN